MNELIFGFMHNVYECLLGGQDWHESSINCGKKKSFAEIYINGECTTIEIRSFSKCADTRTTMLNGFSTYLGKLYKIIN